MISKFVIYSTVAVIVLVAAATARSHGDGKRGGPRMPGCFKEGLNGTMNAAKEKIHTAIHTAMMECVQSMGILVNMSHHHGSGSADRQGKGHHGAPHHEHKEGKGNQSMCLPACGLKKIGLLSADSTQLNRTVFLSLVKEALVTEVQDTFVQEMETCLTNEKLSTTTITLGDKCLELMPYFNCGRIAREKACPGSRDSTTMSPAFDMSTSLP